MSKKKTIDCDKCGHRMYDIPEKCPECGEAIRDRMDPHLYERIAPIMNMKPRLEFPVNAIFIALIVFLDIAGILLFTAFNNTRGLEALVPYMGLIVCVSIEILAIIVLLIPLRKYKCDIVKPVFVIHLVILVPTLLGLIGYLI